MSAAIAVRNFETQPSVLAPVIDIRIKTMTTKIFLQRLPIPPSVNALYRDRYEAGIRVAGRAKTIAYKQYENEVIGWRLQNLSEANKARQIVQGLLDTQALKVGYAFHYRAKEIMTQAGGPKKNDTTNRLKALEDSLCKHVLGCDDSLLWDVAGIQKFASATATKSYVDITLEVMDLELTFL